LCFAEAVLRRKNFRILPHTSLGRVVGCSLRTCVGGRDRDSSPSCTSDTLPDSREERRYTSILKNYLKEGSGVEGYSQLTQLLSIAWTDSDLLPSYSE
jgi:hypothetical protein